MKFTVDKFLLFYHNSYHITRKIWIFSTNKTYFKQIVCIFCLW